MSARPFLPRKEARRWKSEEKVRALTAKEVGQGSGRIDRLVVPKAVIAVTALGLGASLAFFPTLVTVLGLPSRPVGIRHFYALFTYPIVQGGFYYWFLSSLLILLAGLLIDGALNTRQQLKLVLGASLLGGAAFVILSPEQQTLVGSWTITYGFLGAAVACAIMNWQRLGPLWRLFVGLIVLAITVGTFIDFSSYVLSLWVPIVFGLFVTLHWLKGQPRTVLATEESEMNDESSPGVV